MSSTDDELEVVMDVQFELWKKDKLRFLLKHILYACKIFIIIYVNPNFSFPCSYSCTHTHAHTLKLTHANGPQITD